MYSRGRRRDEAWLRAGRGSTTARSARHGSACARTSRAALAALAGVATSWQLREQLRYLAYPGQCPAAQRAQGEAECSLPGWHAAHLASLAQCAAMHLAALLWTCWRMALLGLRCC